MKIIKKEVATELREELTAYSEEVNEHRALPSIEDGLRPSSRFLLYCLWKDGHTHDKKYVKCADPVGSCLARYYVHGDQALYGVLTNLAMDWKNNAPLIDFHGGLGDIDDPDASASMRYTECRLSPYAELMLQDLKYSLPAEDWEDNYLQTEKVPKHFLPTLPNLLVNPTIGIGWATACNFLPHSLADITRILQERISGAKTFNFAPSFPSGGEIVNGSDLPNIYASGKGTIKVRGIYRWYGNDLVFTELPYRVGPKKIQKQILKGQEKDGFSQIENIYDDTTLKDGTRLVIETKGVADKDDFVAMLFKYTSLEETYNVNMTALVNGKPKLLSLVEILDYYIAQQRIRLSRKATYFKDNYTAQRHIQEGLKLVLGDIDKAILIIRNSENPATASDKLCTEFGIDNDQAKAILSITLSRLTKLEIDKINQEIEDLTKKIAEQEELINSRSKQDEIWVSELKSLPAAKNITKVSKGTYGQIGESPTESFQLVVNFNNYTVRYEHEEGFDLTVSPKDEIIILTDNARAILREGKDFKVGENKWDTVVKLNKDEKVFGYIIKKELVHHSQIILIDDKGKRHPYHISVLASRATVRGRRLTNSPMILSNFELV